MNKFAANFLGYLVALGLSVLVMVNGYGLTIHSWGWVIWGSIGSSVVGAIISTLNEST